MSENNIFVKYWGSILVGLFLLVCASYVAINGQNIVIQIFDNLDSNIAWLKMLKDNGLFFNYHEQVPFLHGIDRIYLYSPLKAYVWLYMILPVFWAFVTGWFFKIIISVAGFVYLGKVLKLDTDDFNKNIIVFCGFLYGLTPTFPTAAFHFASLPFLLGFLIEYYQKPNKKYDVLFLLYPMFSDFCFFGLFILGYLAAFIVIDALVTKKMKWYMLYPWICLALGYIISEWGLFYLILLSGEETIRSEMVGGTQLWQILFYKAKEIFVYGHYHASSEHTVIVLPICLGYFFYLLFKKRMALYKDYYFWIIVLLILNSLFYGLNTNKFFKLLIATILPPLKGFSFSRFIWLNPFLWYFAFMVALCLIKSKFKYTSDLKFYACIYALIALVGNDSVYNTVKYNLDYQLHKNQDLIIQQGKREQLEADGRVFINREVTYKQFYSEALFNKIKNAIHYDGEWAVAYGFHPAVLEYNKIKTIDGFLSYYSLKYKKLFRKLIEPALENYEKSRVFFDGWSGKAYIYSENFEFRCVNFNNDIKEMALLINTDIFRQLEGKYIFSRFILTNADELNLKFLGVFEDKDSPYKIYVYALKA